MKNRHRLAAAATILFFASLAFAQTPAPPTTKPADHPARPKLVVLIVVDQMRADYVDKFRSQWTGGLKRLLEQGAWFRAAAFPYAATETCVGHATISTGAFPASHGMIANAWWDRETQKMVTCTSDPAATNLAYAGAQVKGGDSAVRMLVPSFAEELKFQSAGGTRVVSFSLKARAALTLAGHRADATAWLDPDAGALVTSSVYGTAPFLEDFAKKHPATQDLGKTWALSLAKNSYLYEEKAFAASEVPGWTPGFPHPLRGKDAAASSDKIYFSEWAASPFADTYLTHLAEAAVDSLSLGKTASTDFLGISYSSVDYVGHTFGPRSWEIQDILIRLDKDLAELFAYLDQKLGRGNYLVALTADHGVAPIPADMQRTGVDADLILLPKLKERIEAALEPFNYPKPAIARIVGNDIYFSPGIYARLKDDPPGMRAVLEAASSMLGVASVYRAEDLLSRTQSLDNARTAFALNYFPGRSGDLFVLQKPYWLTENAAEGAERRTGTGHGSPYYYDQRVPFLLMGYGIHPGEYFDPVTPADIAPTLAALCGVTLATRDGHILVQAMSTRPGK